MDNRITKSVVNDVSFTSHAYSVYSITLIKIINVTVDFYRWGFKHLSAKYIWI